VKILLINPPRFNEVIGNNPALIEEERGFNPPLGLLYLAGYLRRHTSNTVSVLDAQVEGFGYRQIEEFIRKEQPGIVGCTAMTLTLIDALAVVRTAKKCDSTIVTVLGGPHVHLFPRETIAFPEIDFLVLGEGEIAFCELVGAIDRPNALESIRGLVYKKDGRVVETGPGDVIADLDSLPFPARELTPYRRYTSLLAKRTPVTTMFTSRGCPFRCTFCDRPHLGKQFRAHSPEYVIREIEACLKLGIHEFLIYDDTFTVNAHRVMNICEGICGKKLDIGFDIRARVDTVNREMLAALKRANCRAIHYGVEAGTERMLRVLNKGIHLDQAKQVFTETRRAGIQTLAYFMIGSPTETADDIEETFRVIEWLSPDFVHMTIFCPFPGTRAYHDGLENGIFPHDVWREFAARPDSAFQAPHWEENFSREELAGLLVKGYRRFYTRPGYVVRKLMHISSLGELKRKVKAGIKLLHMK
jgi:radical SAM superfamily enzyme YgiQ (UPF0313 family)